MAESKAVVKHAGDGLFIGISASGHAMVMETNSDRSSAPTPVELLLLAVGGCMGADVVEILRKKREQVTEYRIEVRGERRDDYPRSFKKIQLHHIITGDNISEQSVKHAIALSDEKYCSVAASLRPTAEITTTFEVVQGAPAATS